MKWRVRLTDIDAVGSTYWPRKLKITKCSVKLEKHWIGLQVHNSRRPLDHLTLTLSLTFDLIFIGGH